MHPAKSVIAFTTLSGAGYGLFAWFCFVLLTGDAPSESDQASYQAAILVTAGLLATIGLLCSLFHLGHPERAWRALSQWRSSWLSREGVLAMLTFVPMAMLFFGIWLELPRLLVSITAATGLLLCGATVYATSMIYRSIKAIPAWYTFFVPMNYLLMAAASGAVLLQAIDLIRHMLNPDTYIPLLSSPLMPTAALLLAAAGKLLYWIYIHRKHMPDTLKTATGLNGDVRVFEAPHSGKNYLTDEMGYDVAEKTARLRQIIALCTAFLAPAYMITIHNEPLITFATVLMMLAGLALERWLFFAQARHTSMLYYGHKMT